jgi:RNA polymerase sigma-70 factor (ECF subfamily)
MLAKSRALNVLRRRSRRLRAGWEEAERLPDAADTPEEKTLRKERQKQVREAMSRLKDDYRTALLLVYEEEMSYEEAGRVMKKTRKQVENLVCRAKNAMKDQL